MRIFFQANRVENGSRFKFEDKVLQLSYFNFILENFHSPISFILLRVYEQCIIFKIDIRCLFVTDFFSLFLGISRIENEIFNRFIEERL